MQAIDDVLVRRHTGETDRRQLTERMLAAWLCLCSFSLSMFSDVTAAEVGSPNILFILADDLAWADPHCYGHPWHATPNIDRLASLGMRFTQAYAPAPICSASRAAILTGKTPARLNFEFVTRDKPGDQEIDAPTLLRAPPLTLNLPAAEVTMAEVLRDCGYQTAFFGKWHVSAHHQRYLGWSPTHGPRQQGFEVAEEDFGSHPYSWGKTPPETINEAGWFPEDSMVRRVTEFLQREHDRPWFVMASQFYVHTPVKTPCHWLLEKYEQLIPAGTPSRKQRIAYAAFVETLDHYVGRIIDAVPSEDRANTVIVFTSDNGGHPEYAANGPLRGSKWNLYEGGIRVPLVVRWPHGFQGGSVCHGPVTGCDLMPTFAALAVKPDEAAVSLPADLDGQSFLTLLSGGGPSMTRKLIWHFPYYHPERGYAKAPDRIGINDFFTSRTHPHSALRRGNHKLIWFHEDSRTELYDLESDPSEQHDLSEIKSPLRDQLLEELQRNLQAMHARFATPSAPALRK